MASYRFTYFFIVFAFINQTKAYNVHFNLPEITEPDFNMRSHLKFDNVGDYCSRRDEACTCNNTNICAVKIVNKKKLYKDFLNGCYLFLFNMCDHPEEEYVIANAGSCTEYLSVRRSGDNETDAVTEEETTTEGALDDNMNDTELALRAKKFSTLYDIDTAYDYHPCPFSCPDTYSPVCVNINRGQGKYFKMMSFLNHCHSDLYYCKNWREFEPPPGEEESVRSSPLSWSFCGASRYLQFARFSESASSLGHYGWLHGDYKFSNILEPHQRQPGYG